MGNTIAMGTVKWWNDSKGFGFITPADGSSDVFAHYSVVVTAGFRTLREGQLVSYRVELEPNGPRAVEIVPMVALKPTRGIPNLS